MVKEKIFFVKSLKCFRKVAIYTPSNYDTSKKYKVIYMFDGANLFRTDYSLFGNSWEVEKTIESYIKKTKKDGFIVVGLFQHPKRRGIEYAPCYLGEGFKPEKEKKPQGPDTLSFYVDQLKPYIDKHYSTDKDNSIIAGSSFGGIMAIYSGLTRSDVFKTIGCFSYIDEILDPSFRKFVEKTPLPKENKVYIYYGGKEDEDKKVNKMFQNDNDRLVKVMKKKKASLEVDYDAKLTHTEKSWAKYFLNFIKFIDK